MQMGAGTGVELCLLDLGKLSVFIQNFKYCFFIYIFLGCQSVRDRIAQAGTPILKFTCIYTKNLCTLCIGLDSLTGKQHTEMPDQMTWSIFEKSDGDKDFLK